jgi:MFS family permease
LLALGSTVLGAVVGALAPNATVLLAGRVVEGIGLGVISVVAPAIISRWFPPAERGLPMGIWASWVPVGNFIIFNLAGTLLNFLGWQGLWWFGALFAVAAFVVYAGLVSDHPADRGGREAQAEAALGQWLLNPASWVLALLFATFTFAFTGYGTWAPSYLGAALGLDPEAANFDASLSSLAVIPSTMVAGWVLDRTRNRKAVLAAAFLGSGLLLSWSFRLGSAGLVAPYFIVLGAVAGFIPTTAFTLAPETMPRPELAGLALGILSVGQNLGAFLGAPAVAAVIRNGNWAAGVIPLVAAIALGLGATWLLNVQPAPGRPAVTEPPPA